jgi:predicted RNA-binding Zn-ribbon protein involved in translation (DUF1610 family)
MPIERKGRSVKVENGFTRNKCPRCGGILYRDRTYYREGDLVGCSEQETCLQCGYVNYFPDKPRSSALVAAGLPVVTD